MSIYTTQPKAGGWPRRLGATPAAAGRACICDHEARRGEARGRRGPQNPDRSPIARACQSWRESSVTTWRGVRGLLAHVRGRGPCFELALCRPSFNFL